MGKILLASNNQGKLIEIKAVLEGQDIQMLTPKELGIEIHVVENGTTYAENAALKATAFSQASGMISLADDSGLEVACLGGQPGLHSARYSLKPGATDADRRSFLLEKLVSYEPPWEARFHCTVALGTIEGDVLYAEGECQGEIIAEERGSNGFGYDPIFYLPQIKRTMAELTLQEKNLLSHRARAVRAALPHLQLLFSQQE